MSETLPINRDMKQFKKFWNNSSLQKRNLYIRLANLIGYFNPKLNWQDIETNQQSKLREAIRYMENENE